MSAATKQKRELSDFLRFAQLAGLSIADRSIRQLDPPSPDILCNVGETLRAFELTALTDPAIEKQFGTGNFQYTNYRIDPSDVVRCIEIKARKTYSTANVELVVHEGFTPVEDLWLCNQSELNDRIAAALGSSPFIRLWLVDYQGGICRSYDRVAA